MEHPRLRVVTDLFLDDFFVEKSHGAFKCFRLNIDAGLPREAHAPHDIRRHEVIAFAFLPPTPTTVGMLEVVKPFQALLSDLLEFLQITATVRMSCRGTCLLDAAEDLVHRG